MGVVHLAEGSDGQVVALKVLRPQLVGDHEGRQRLAQEVASLEHVRSPHVAEVLDSDPWGETPFVAVRYVDGLSLRELVSTRGPLPAPGLGHVASTLLAAVRDVHRAGVLHRDLKPTNVVMEGRSPVLIDFGLARLAEDPRLTATGLMLGTPGYLAPEVLAGEPASVATDIHGWAATVAYAATGRPPYGTGHAMAVLDRTRRGQVDLDGVPSGLRPLLAACLSVDPAQRPSIETVGAELESWVTTGAVSLADPTAGGSSGAHLGEGHVDPTRQVTVVAPTRAPGPSPAPAPSRIAPTPAAGAAQAPAPTSALGPARGPAPAQAPAPAAPPQHRQGTPPSAATRLLRAAMLLGVLAAVVAGFRHAPYLTIGVLGVSVPVLRGISRTQDSVVLRRDARGRRWYDGAQAVLGYPWHLLAGSVGALVLLLAAILAVSFVVALLVVLGVGTDPALLAGGALLGLLVFWGPGARRVRRPLERAALRVSRQVLLGGVVLALVWLAVLALVLSHAQSGVVWTPDDRAPWEHLRDLLPPIGSLGG